MHLKDVSGTDVRLSLSDLVSHLTSRLGGLFLLLCMALLLFSDPPGLLHYLSLHQALFVWLCALAIYLAGYFVISLAVSGMQARGRLHGFPTPFVGLIIIAPTVSASEMLVAALAPPEYQITILSRMVFYYLIVQILEFFFIRFLLPLNNPVVAVAPVSGQRTISVADRAIPVRRLRYLSAQEHYVRIVLDSESFLHRVRLSDLVAQLRDDDGVQPHRSWWIGRHARPVMVRQDGRQVLRLFDETLVPVARGRQREVVDWLDAHGPFDSAPESRAAAE